MKVFDRYLVRELLKPIVCSAATLIALILIADLFDNLDEFLRYRTSPAIILRYYALLIPYAFVQIAPWAAWLGTVFLLVNFGLHNETMAMKAAGLEITTIIKPIFFIGFLMGIVLFILNDRVVPSAYRNSEELKDIYIAKRKLASAAKIFRNVTYLSKEGQLYYFRTFSPAKNELRDVIGLWLDPNAANTRRKMMARKGFWKEDHWEFEDVTEHHMDSRGRILGEPKIFPIKIYPEINLTPKELISVSSESSFLSYRELKKSIQKLRENGVGIQSELVDLHDRLASPWQSLVMMMICVPLLAKTAHRKLIAYNVLLCVGFIFVFHVLGAVGIALGKAGKIFPFLSAWLGNIIFGVGSLVTLEHANH